jgi:two-component system, NtrC family, nitrogen regulation sensor histidine kinase NtrY
MSYKNITLSALLYILAIVALSFWAGYLWFEVHQVSGVTIIALVEILLVTLLIQDFNRTNRSLAYFFESIENDDRQLQFSTKVKNKSQQRLHESLNRVNALISEITLKNERNEHYFHELIQHSATGLIALNTHNQSELINSKACELLGISMNANFSLLEHRNPELWTLICAIKSGETLTRKIFQDGAYKHLSIRASEIKFNDSVVKLLSVQDIKQELEIRELESWQKLIRILTHEIMNSVAPITSLSNTLRKFFSTDKPPLITDQLIEDTVQGLQIIEERGKALIEFVGNYRQLTKIPPPKPSEFSVYNWLNKIRILMHEQLNQNNIQIDISVDKKADLLFVDEQLMSQVVINIVKNAMDALMEKPASRKIKILVEINNSNQHQITISNNGKPILPDDMEKVFIPFFSTKEGGSGIGLSLSQQIVQMHNGYIYVVSNEHSTQFVIVL